MIPSFHYIEDLIDEKDYKRFDSLNTIIVTTCFIVSLTTVFIYYNLIEN